MVNLKALRTQKFDTSNSKRGKIEIDKLILKKIRNKTKINLFQK